MSATHTAISWTDRTWNPLRGCSLVSPGCTHCYAMRQAGRFSAPGQPYEGLVRKTSQGYKWTGKVRVIEKDLEAPLRWKKPQRIFVNSMSDLFHEHVPDPWIDHIMVVMALADRHQFQILTKRPRRMLTYLTNPVLLERLRMVRHGDVQGAQSYLGASFGTTTATWPLPNVWLGVSAENHATADERIPWLLKTPAVVRFVSYEPALEAVDFTRIRMPGAGLVDALTGRFMDNAGQPDDAGGPFLDWIIVGGESGPKARPFHLPWARRVIRQCQCAHVPVWMKQVGARPCIDGTGGDRCDDHTFYKVRDRAGADPMEWPDDLRVQQFPEVRV